MQYMLEFHQPGATNVKSGEVRDGKLLTGHNRESGEELSIPRRVQWVETPVAHSQCASTHSVNLKNAAREGQLVGRREEQL